MGRFERIIESVGTVLRQPDEPGVYWVNDTYGWEAVMVTKKFGTHGELVFMKCGIEGDFDIVPRLNEWVRIEPPK